MGSLDSPVAHSDCRSAKSGVAAERGHLNSEDSCSVACCARWVVNHDHPCSDSCLLPS